MGSSAGAVRAAPAAPGPGSTAAPPAGGVWSWCRQVAAWTVILACAAALTAGVLVPRLGDGTPYAVLTGSMRPTLPPGTLVVVRPAAPEAIGIGTVITYQLRSGESRTVTHRVVEVRTDLTGDISYRTQGDANDAPDAAWVRPEQVRGALWYDVPHLGRAHWLLTGDQRELAVLLVAGALGLYATGMFVGAGRDRRRTQRPGSAS